MAEIVSGMLDTNFSYQVQHIGHEQQPILIIDNFVKDAASLIDYAMSKNDVAPDGGHYPGLRSKGPELYQSLLVSQLSDLLSKVFTLSSEHLRQADSFYSLVATPVSDLTLIQQLAHFDQPKDEELAVIHYLCNDSHGGTSFYRHRSTGFESINQERNKSYLASLEKDIKQLGVIRAPKYLNGDDELFERIVSVPAKFNRAVIYRCSSLHSGDISADYKFDMNPYSGRFTIASFIHS